ncbi:ectopic P granules protein 5 homolog isoform X1 [Diabrotica virgifera virgifera]|uniref:Ectopic P granules protein 5 homolog n=1 Tax=Diabrotica virgifera virgifera TaxID=50390 RepID=A0A6P7FM59_DIAVI|nr:ectopic P granules protein 5 homolog isoform X1 [Diabrotica virgifera virgifera]
MEIAKEKVQTKKKKKNKSSEGSSYSSSQKSSEEFLKTISTSTSNVEEIPAIECSTSSLEDAKQVEHDQEKAKSDHEQNQQPVEQTAMPSNLEESLEINTIKDIEDELSVGIENEVVINKNVVDETTGKISAELEKILDENKKLANDIKMTDKITENYKTITKNSETEAHTEMKPYTETQLNSLYYNQELETLEEFIEQYVNAELKGLAIKQHPLYELLTSYLRVQEKITGNTLELDQIRKEYKTLQNDLWTIETATVVGRGECQDGSVVSATHSYNKSIFHRSVFQSIVRILGNVQTLTYENHTLYSYSAEDLRIQIESYLQGIIMNCLNVTQLSNTAPVALTVQEEPPHLKPYLGELRICISILFSFQRKLIREMQFIKETRLWLSRLVAVLLRLANYQDHLFVLNHVLRCPAGVGSWASAFIQTPVHVNASLSPFANFEINHVLTILAAILTPVRGRELFLEDLSQKSDTVAEAIWVMVDSEGEEDEDSPIKPLKENDLVALLNQLPLDDLFRNMLVIKQKNFQDVYDVAAVTEHHILRYLAFSTVVLRILHKGIKTYDQPRYNQFSKRLSRFIRHVAQYATDQWEQFLKVQKIEDMAMLERLQVEYDAFFLRAIYYLYSSQKLGAWQFLAVVPYNMVSLKGLWKIFYFLHSVDSHAVDILNRATEDYRKKIWESELRSQFEEKLGTLEDAEVYYLLNTFANMALARDKEDMDFIFSATVDLLKVGFISETTQENCCKSARILLTHITSKYPHLLSNILKEVKDNMDKIGALSLYLYEELPLSVWKITESDLELISRLLLNNSMSTYENKMARMILSRLNWDTIPYEIHCDVAILVVQCVYQEPGIENWAWQTILRLKLHVSDKAFKEIGRVQDMERYDILMKGVREQNCLAVFVTLLMTSWGHLVPLICTKGLPQLLYLQTQQKHEAVLFVLYVVIPLFINSQECIINLERFQDILMNLLNADRGYISMAKNLVYGQNTVLQQFGNMVESQIMNYGYYNLESPRCLVRLWCNSLVSIPGWNKDMGIMYLLDVIIRTGFQHPDAIDAVYEILREQSQCGTPQENVGTISSLFKWVSSTNTNGSLISNSLSTYTWLAYVVISVEHEERERRTGLWNEVLIQLSKQKGKVNVDQAIKKAASALKIPAFTSGYLSIYRWAQQALDTPLDHPLLPLLWQKFFTLHLARIPNPSIVEKACVGEKFFEGMVNFTFQKKIKRRLQESVDYFMSKLDVKDEDNPELSKKPFYQKSHRIFKAFSLWLEEPTLQENNILLKNLPPQYESGYLVRIMQGEQSPWVEFLDAEQLTIEQQFHIRIWRVNNFREKTNVNKPLLNAGSRVESDDPIERILRRLTSYDKPKPAPSISLSAPVVPNIEFGSKDEMFKSLEPCFKTLKQCAHNHNLKLSEQKALDSAYKELVPQLYRSVLNRVKKKVPCKGKNQTVYCSGAAEIVLEMQEARINERIDHQIQANRNTYESLLGKALQLSSLNLCVASVSLQKTIKTLQSQLHCNPATAELGVELFYYILSLLNEEINSYPPTKTLFSMCLEKLGQSHICGVEYEMPRLLQRILQDSNLGEYLAPHFSPCNVGTANLLLMYSTICKEVGKYDVAFALLSKFEIENWLRQKSPKISQRSQFIQSVIQALTTLGFDPPMASLTLHCLYEKHLLTVFEFQFPEHYGEVLVLLLKSSSGNPETNLVAISVWMSILNFLAQPVVLNLKLPLRDQLRQYAQHQHILQHQELLETAELLARHFTQERLQYGIYGLYPKCRSYMDVYMLLLGTIGHGIIVSMLNTHQGLLGDKLCEKIWPYIRDMFAPWLVPYSMQNLKDNMASWIQQLADDRSVLLPWIPADTQFAQKILCSFKECISFVIHTLPASSSILSYIWQWYVTCYAHKSVKEHILMAVHQTFLTFPWHNFWPSIIDVECMLKVIDQYLPDCHAFLGHIFMAIPWTNWLNNLSTAPTQLRTRVYQCFINLIVKLCNEPNVRKNHSEQAKSILVQAENFDWTILDASFYQYVLDWLVMSCDSSVIFKNDPLDVDYRMLHFLKIVSMCNGQQPTMSPETLSKRLTYVRTCVKLLSVYTNRNKSNIPRKEQDIYTLITRQLNDIEHMVSTEEEMITLLKEMLCCLNIESVKFIALKSFAKWVENKPGDGLIIRCLLQTMGTTVTEYDVLAELLEVTVNSYFLNTVLDGVLPSWREIGELLNILANKQTELQQAALNRNCLLALNAIFVQLISKHNNTEILLNLCLDWMMNIKINESTEPKIPLIWCGFLMLVLQHAEKDEPTSGTILYKFTQILLQICDEKGPSKWGRGLLNVIGLSKQGNVSLDFKFLCRALAGYILAQLPEMKGEPQVIRKFANAPSKVGQSGGNTECVKVLLTMDFGQSQGKIKECAGLALKQIQDSNNSLHNARKFVMLIVKQFYTKPYLTDVG